MNPTVVKAKTYIGWVLGISWIYGFVIFHLANITNEISIIILQIIWAFLPAIAVLIVGEKKDLTWSGLNFSIPSIKKSFLAFLFPIIYLGLILYVELLFDFRTRPNLSSIKIENFPLLKFLYVIILVLGEEIGWRGYLQQKLTTSYGDLKGIVILGLVWGIWHLPLALTGNNFSQYPLMEALILYPLMGIAISLIIAYLGLFKHSIYIAIILHTTHDIAYISIFPLTQMNNQFANLIVSVTVFLILMLIFGRAYQGKTFYNKELSKTKV